MDQKRNREGTDIQNEKEDKTPDTVQFCFFLNYLKYTRTTSGLLKNPPANAGDAGSIPKEGRHPRKGNGNLLQYSCPGNPMDRGA